MTDRYVVDSTWWRRRSESDSAGDTVVAGSPLRMFRFAPGARETLDALESSAPPPADAGAVITRLLDAGAVHPLVDPTTTRTTPSQVTVVIPAHDEPIGRLQSLVDSLTAAYSVLVVDDGSDTPIPHLHGATIVRRDTAGGPAGARNTGLDHVSTPIVLFLDADTEFDPDSWPALLAHFDDDRVGIVAPRVRSTGDNGVLARYERSDSPLDLGVESARISPNTRVSYAPTAALAVRVELFDRHGRFDETLRYGEDVDFVWRVCAAGETCRYEPTAIVGHRPRSGFADAFRQRVSYGSAAAPLERRHPGFAAPLRLNRWTAVAWSLLIAGHPFFATGVASGSTIEFARRLTSSQSRADATAIALRLAGRGNLHAGRLIGSAMWRTWWPITVVASLLSRRARRAALAALVIPNVWRWREHRNAGTSDLDLLRYSVCRAVDDIAYGTGVWKGAVAERSARALKPRCY